MENDKPVDGIEVLYTRDSVAKPRKPLPEDVTKFLLDRRRFGSYVEKADRLIRYLERNGMDFTLDNMLAYLDWLIERERRSSTVNVAKFHIKRIVLELMAERPDEWTVLKQFEIERVFTRLRHRSIQSNDVGDDQVLTPAEIERLIAACDPYIGLVTTFIAETGARVSEAVGVVIQDCEPRGDQVRIPLVGKRGKQRTVWCRADLFDRIRSTFGGKWGPLFRTQNDTPYTRAFVHRKISEAGRAAVGRRVTVHMLRHSFATNAIAAGADLKAVSEYLGHSTERITADMYVHTRLSEEHLPRHDVEPTGATPRKRSKGEKRQ